MYSKFEEEHGLISHSLQILDRALKDIKTDKLQFFNYYLAKTTQYYGITKSRALFERAFQILKGADLIQVGLRFAKLERKLGEIERARNIYMHLS